MFDVTLLPGRKNNQLWSGFIERPYEALSGPPRTGGTCASCGEGVNSGLLERSGGRGKISAGVFCQGSGHRLT